MKIKKSIESLNRYFSIYLPEGVFIKRTHEILKQYRFDKNNTLPLVCICRDEKCQSVFDHVSKYWIKAFNLSSLGGMFIAGITAINAALSHAPETDERKRYVFYAMPHIAIDKNGSLGKCARFGIINSTACGALMGIYNELKNGQTSAVFDEEDIEMSIIRKRLINLQSNNNISDLLVLTKIARVSMQVGLENAIYKVLDTSESDYAIITGIQIHAEDNRNYVAPDESYVVLNGNKKDISLI